MEISQNLPQFESPALIIASGWHKARFFYVNSGKISEGKMVEVDPHKYSDKEGHFERSTAGAVGVMGSGSVRETPKQHIRDEFLNLFLENLEGVLDKMKVENIYLFSPQEGLPSMEDSLPNHIRDLLAGCYAGNYLKHTPLDLIEIIDENKPEPIEVMSDEAKKIIEKGS